VIDALHTAMEHENPSDNEEVLRRRRWKRRRI
jgi:hypothetical protein